MTLICKKTPVIDGADIYTIKATISNLTSPVIIKGLVKHWPLVQAGLQSDRTAIDYLTAHYNGKNAGVYFGAADINGRFGYNASATELNFSINKMPLDEMLEKIHSTSNIENAESLYIASNSIDHYFPSLRQDNDIAFADDAFSPLTPKEAGLLASIWIGNKTVVACHYDAQSNLACCIAGRRRFTLFPPDQIANLYPGPLAPTPGGQVISMVDFANPDFEKHPKFKLALESAQVAEMEPGDALLLPSMWWHQVEGLAPFNILINYWWNTTPSYLGQPADVLTHALLSIKNCPPEEKKAWKAIFDYYIFSEENEATTHLPKEAHGALAKIDPLMARRLRGKLLNKLNR